MGLRSGVRCGVGALLLGSALGAAAAQTDSAAVAAAAGVEPQPLTPLFEQFDSRSGFPSRRVFALAQDAEGFLWAGTGDGLARYDGRGFEVFRHDSSREDTLPANTVQALHVDERGRLWLGTEGAGLAVLESAREGRFRTFNARSHPRVPVEDVFAITSDVRDRIWFGGYRSGLWRMATDGSGARQWPGPGEAVSIEPEVSAASTQPRAGAEALTVLSLLRAEDGEVWVGTSVGLCRIEAEQLVCSEVPDQGPRAQWIWSLSQTEDGRLRVGTGRALWLFDAAATTTASAWEALPGLDPAHVLATLDDGQGHLWVGMTSALYSLTAGRWQAHPAMPGQRRGLPTPRVLAMLRDHEQGLWFGTDGGGLARLPPSWRNFSVFRHGVDSFETLPAQIAPGTGSTLWIVAKERVLERLDLRSGSVEDALSPDLPPGARLNAVLEASDGTLWVGHSRGLRLYRPDGGIQRYEGDAPDAPPQGPLDHLLETPEGVWLAVVGEALQLRDREGRLREDLRPGQQDLPSLETEQLLLGPDGAVWWAGPGGLWRRPPGGRFQRVPGSPDARVFALAFAGGGELWLHRLAGLERYRLLPERIERIEGIGPAQGLPELESGGLQVLPDGELWLTTARGLFRYRPPKGERFAELRQFGEASGLPSAEFRLRQGPLQLADGRLAALNLRGVVVFDPAQLSEQLPPSPLRWTGARVLRGGKRVELDAGGLQLRHSDRDLSVGVRLLSFADPQSNAYRFQLEGVDPGWIHTGNTPERSYAQLPSGEYRLRVSAAAADGRWLPALERSIVVAAPPWSTPWAWAAYALLLLLLGWGGLSVYRARVAARYRLHLAEERGRMAQQAAESKGRFLATLGHELRTPMTGLLGMNALLLGSSLSPQQRQQAEVVQRTGQMMLRLLNEALDLARIEAGRLELLPQPVHLGRLVDEVLELMQPLADAKGLRLNGTLAAGLPEGLALDPLRLQQILLNLLGNAIKFGQEGEVRLAVAGEALEPGRWRLCFAVHDRGPGLSPEQLARLFQPFSQADGALTAQRHGGSGLGLSISRQLAELMDGELSAESEVGVGSCFRLRLAASVCTPPPQAQAAVTPAPAPGLRVLLVEDHPDVAAALSGLLRSWGCQVEHAAHALAALAEVARSPFDVALLDVDLPGVDGIELCRLLAGRVGRRIVLTARVDPGTDEAAQAAGAERVLTKPADPARLRAALTGN
jgi:signal transduction histidine kinase/CheY-like chemotaxis protein/streptogramin lyase